MFNPVIILAILMQSFVSRASKITGAVLGVVITTGILLWGFSVYGGGNQIAFFGKSIPEGMFVILCLVWYGFDAKGLIDAKKASKEATDNQKALTDPAVRAAWASTWRAWRAGQGAPVAQAEAGKLSEQAFVDGYIKKTGRMIQSIVSRHAWEADEFILHATINPAQDHSVLTDRTLYLFARNDIQSGPVVIPLSDIDSYSFSTKGRGHILIKLHSGQVIDQERNAAPKEEFVNRYRTARQLT